MAANAVAAAADLDTDRDAVPRARWTPRPTSGARTITAETRNHLEPPRGGGDHGDGGIGTDRDEQADQGGDTPQPRVEPTDRTGAGQRAGPHRERDHDHGQHGPRQGGELR